MKTSNWDILLQSVGFVIQSKEVIFCFTVQIPPPIRIAFSFIDLRSFTVWANSLNIWFSARVMPLKLAFTQDCITFTSFRSGFCFKFINLGLVVRFAL
jgi:hypothetical protein